METQNGGRQRRKSKQDGLHLSQYGSAVLAKTLKATIRYYNREYYENKDSNGKVRNRHTSRTNSNTSRLNKRVDSISYEQKRAAVEALVSILT
jgi:hypothetical protein